MATATRPKITADEFFEMDLGDGLYELVDGEVVAMSPPEYLHGYVAGDVYSVLRAFGLATGHGHAATCDSAARLNEYTVRGPDVSYYSEARWPRSEVKRGRPPVPPDLAVEVLSPGNRAAEMLGKVRDYLAAGVLMVWVVDPRTERLTIYRGDDPTPRVLGPGDVVEGLPELPGFRAPLAEFFE